MTRHLNSLGEMAAEFVTMTTRTSLALGEGLERIMARVERDARAQIGKYQPSVGPFPEWPLLSDAYEHEKVTAGYPADAPLRREGDMEQSFGHETDRMALEGIAGATDRKMPYHEFGTETVPARPVWGPALFKNKAFVERLVGAAVATGLIGSDRIHEALGYDHRTSD